MIDLIKQVLNKYIQKSQYKKNVLIMIVGRVTAQVIPILLTPVLTRIYSPADFGIFGVFSAIIAIVAMLSNGRYCLSIILPKDETKSQKLFFLSSALTILTFLLFVIVLLVGGERFFLLLNIPTLQNYISVIVLTMLLVGLYENLYYYGIRIKAFNVLTTNIIAQASILIIARLSLGYLGFTESGLMISYLLGYTVSFILMMFRLKIPLLKLLKEFELKTYVKLLKEYYKFPKYSLPADTLSMLSTMSPTMLLNRVFGTVATGFYTMSDKILGSPIWLVTSSVGDVFKQEAAEQFRSKGSCFDIFRKTAKTMFLLGIIPFGLLFLFSPYVVPFLLGAEWEPVGDFIRIFSVMYFVKFLVRPVYSVLYIVNRQNYNAIFQGLHLISIVVAFIVGIATSNLYFTLVIWTILASITYLIIFLFSYKFAKETLYAGEEEL